MLDQQDGDAALADFCEQAHEALGFRRVHAGDRFVEQQQGRIGGERHRDLEQPLLAVGQRGAEFSAPVAKADELQGFLRAVAQLSLLAGDRRQSEHDGERRLFRAAMQADQHVVERGLAGEDAGLLERPHDALFRDLVRLQAQQRLAAIMDRAGCGRDVAGDGVERAGLAGAVRADQRQHLAFHDVEGQIGDGDQAAETQRQVRHLKCSRHTGAPATRGAGNSGLLPSPPAGEGPRVGGTRKIRDCEEYPPSPALPPQGGKGEVMGHPIDIAGPGPLST